jgi:hypothetical protein
VQEAADSSQYLYRSGSICVLGDYNQFVCFIDYLPRHTRTPRSVPEHNADVYSGAANSLEL